MIKDYYKHLKRLKRKNSKIISLIAYMLKNGKLIYMYKDSFSGVCEEIVWKQKCVATLTAPGIDILSKRGKGKYVFNEKACYFILYSEIMKEEKKETVNLLQKHKAKFLTKHKLLFRKQDGFSVPMFIEMKEKLSQLCDLFAMHHLIVKAEGNFNTKSSIKKRIKSIFDQLIYSVDNHFIPDELEGDSLSYFASTLKRAVGNKVTNYEQIKNGLIELWDQYLKTEGKIPLPFVLPTLKEELQNFSAKVTR